jgi:hypothetical protein
VDPVRVHQRHRPRLRHALAEGHGDEGEHLLHLDGKGERIKKTVELVPIPANARASAQPEHQVSDVPASVDALADLVNNATGGAGGFELQTN